MSSAGTANLVALEPLERQSTAQVIAAQLRRAILDGSFPAGARLPEVQLARRLGVSRGPLREAMQRLIQEGLVEDQPHRGVSVVRLTGTDVRDLYFVREVLEVPTALALARQPDRETLRRLRLIVADMAEAGKPACWPELVELDVEFHRVVVDSASSARLTRMFDTVGAEMRLCLGALKPAYPSHYDVAVEHRGLLKAIRDGKAGEVRRLWTTHLREAAANLGAQAA